MPQKSLRRSSTGRGYKTKLGQYTLLIYLCVKHRYSLKTEEGYEKMETKINDDKSFQKWIGLKSKCVTYLPLFRPLCVGGGEKKFKNMAKLNLTWQNQGRAFNFRSGCMCHFYSTLHWSKTAWLKIEKMGVKIAKKILRLKLVLPVTVQFFISCCFVNYSISQGLVVLQLFSNKQKQPCYHLDCHNL